MPPALKHPPKEEIGLQTKPESDSLATVLNSPEPKRRSRLPGVLLLIFSLFLLLAVIPSLALIRLRPTVSDLQTNIVALRQSFSTKDLAQVSKELERTRQSVDKLERDLGPAKILIPIPFVGGYVSDARSGVAAAKSGIEAAEIVLKTIGPYADLLGLKTKPTLPDGQKTAQDRITFVVETLDKIAPQLDEIAQKMETLSRNLSSIDPNRYPTEFRGYKIREAIVQAQTLSREALTLTRDAKPLLEASPYILGNNQKRTYLVLFQNDAELRATGGFMTAYAIIEVQKGKAKPLLSADIYDLDKKYNPTLKAPEALVKYISYPYQDDPRWRLRDMNMDPDFKYFADAFLPEYYKTKSPQVDGIIAVDTQMLVKLLRVIGQIGVPGYGNFSSETLPKCNCPQVFYELESIADVTGPIVWDPVSGKVVYRPPHSDNRKGVIGPLMNSILANAVGQPKEKLAQLIQVGLESIQEKHLLMYFADSKIQSAIEAFNIGGRVREEAGDYLFLVSSNMAGAKSNMYVQTNIEDKITVEGSGVANHDITVNFSNPQKHDGWLNGDNRNYFRVYVPLGSTLNESTGSEVKITTTEQYGKTVFSGFITVRPAGGVARFNLKYSTPPVVKEKKYNLLIQKQPGTKNDPYAITINNREQEFDLSSDREITQTVK